MLFSFLKMDLAELFFYGFGCCPLNIFFSSLYDNWNSRERCLSIVNEDPPSTRQLDDF